MIAGNGVEIFTGLVIHKSRKYNGAMNPLRRSISAVLSALVFCLFASSFAQSSKLGGNVVQFYSAQEVSTRQGLIAVSPDSFTTLEFEDEIESLFFRRGDVVRCVNCRQEEKAVLPPDGGSLILAALKGLGSTDLIVKVGGSQLYFKIEVAKGNFSQLVYRIRSKPLPTSTSPIQGQSTAQVKDILASRSEASDAPQWLRYRITPSLSVTGVSRVVLIVDNPTNALLQFASVSPKIYDLGGTEVPYSLTVTSHSQFGGALEAGGSYRAVLSLKDVNLNDLRLEWKVQKGEDSYTIRRVFDPALAR